MREIRTSGSVGAAGGNSRGDPTSIRRPFRGGAPASSLRRTRKSHGRIVTPDAPRVAGDENEIRHRGVRPDKEIRQRYGLGATGPSILHEGPSRKEQCLTGNLAP